MSDIDSYSIEDAGEERIKVVLSNELCCSICGKQVETYNEIVYSQGSKVCLECKKGTQASDNKAFDRDMALRRLAT